jgi:hypothetical protein
MPLCLLAMAALPRHLPANDAAARPRIMIETDAGGDPDDEQSLVRFLLYCSEWDVEGIIANRPEARDKENLNEVRTGLGIVRRMIDAYGQCHQFLRQHDARFPTAQALHGVTKAGYEDVEDGVNLVIAAVDRQDPRPLWFCNWGTKDGCARSCLLRALDRVLRERGEGGYVAFKSRIRLASDDQFGEHTFDRAPPFALWVDTFRPPLENKRWYHRFSALTATAGGFDIEKDVRTGHGPLGALYPTNTTHPQKEGDTMTFLYLIPTGMNDPEQPGWGSWAGRYGPRDGALGRPYFWANQADHWRGSTHRDQTVARWAEDFQNDFKARLDWCVHPRDGANHPPVARVEGVRSRFAKAGETIIVDAGKSRDPDGDPLEFQWFQYAEAGTYAGQVSIDQARQPRALLRAPSVKESQTIHVIARVADRGNPPLARYQRVVVRIEP